MAFHDTWVVRKGDNLTKIARAAGFKDPGPIAAYPPNAERFRGKSVDLIHPGEQLLIPWRPDLLQKYIATCVHLGNEVAQSAAKLIQGQVRDKQEIDQFLSMIDWINFFAGQAVGIGSLAVQGARGVEMSSKEAILYLVESRLAIGTGIASNIIPSPTAPRRDFKFFVRHTLGPWNPSFWASVYVAIHEGDVDIYLYGTDATAYKTSLKIKQQAERDIAALERKIAAARLQLAQPFYKARLYR